MEVKTFDKMSEEERIEALLNYKRQAPEKYERDKEALFAKYGLKAKDVKFDDNEEELLAMKATAKKTKKENE